MAEEIKIFATSYSKADTFAASITDLYKEYALWHLQYPKIKVLQRKVNVVYHDENPEMFITIFYIE